MTTYNQTQTTAVRNTCTTRRTVKAAILGTLGGLVMLAALDAQAAAQMNGLYENGRHWNGQQFNGSQFNGAQFNTLSNNAITSNGLPTEQQNDRLPWHSLSHQGLSKSTR